MRAIFRSCCLFLCGARVVFTPSCIAQDTETPQSKRPIAIIAGESIFDEQLPSTVLGQLHRFHQQEFETRRAALEEIVNHRLLEAEAHKKAVTVDKLLEMEVDAKVVEPTPGELEAYYQDQKEHVSESFDQAKPKLKDELKQLKLSSAREAYLKLLQQQAEVAIFVNPPRMKISYDPLRLNGSPNALVTIVEFSDFTCPFCRQVNSTLKKVIAKYQGKVSLAYRDFPMSELHPQAQLAAEASRCAAEQGKFWEYHDSLFDSPGNLTREDLAKSAENLHLYAKQFDSCLSSGKYKAQVDQDFQDGLRVGVFGTPGFFINGVFLAGSQPVAAFEKIVDQELAGLNQSRASSGRAAPWRTDSCSAREIFWHSPSSRWVDHASEGRIWVSDP